MSGETLEINEKCLLTELVDGTGVLLDLDTKFYFTLNVTGVEVWKAIRAGIGQREQLAARLVAEFEVEPVAAQRDLAQVLDVMLREGLVKASAR
jgi:hypothetical protein